MYRDDTLIYTGPNTTNQYTDNTQLSISTVYEYSVVAVSCAGNSTAGVKSVTIGGDITYTLTSPLLRYDRSDGTAQFSWVSYLLLFHTYQSVS